MSASLYTGWDKPYGVWEGPRSKGEFFLLSLTPPYLMKSYLESAMLGLKK